MRGWIKSAGGLLKPAAVAIAANVVAAAGSGTTIAIPTHASGDYIFIAAYRDGNNNTATVPAGWTALSPTGLVGSNTNTLVLAYKVAASSSETSGTWTNASGLMVAVVKAAGAGPLGLGNDSNITEANSTTVSAAALTLANTNGHSVVLHFAGHRNTDPNPATPPAGMSNGAGSPNNGGNCTMGVNYTTYGVSSWSLQTAAWGGTASNWCSTTVEVTGAA